MAKAGMAGFLKEEELSADSENAQGDWRTQDSIDSKLHTICQAQGGVQGLGGQAGCNNAVAAPPIMHHFVSGRRTKALPWCGHCHAPRSFNALFSLLMVLPYIKLHRKHAANACRLGGKGKCCGAMQMARAKINH
jgi:hypothetical protein